jgi:hypothetical protein
MTTMPTAETVPVPAASAPAHEAELPEQWIELARTGQRTAIETVRTFVETLERTLPSRGEGASRRRELVEAALELADKLAHAQYDLLRHAVASAVLVNVDVDVDVDVDVASRATRAIEEAQPASARG